MSDSPHTGIEIERKYIIEIPAPALMESCEGYSKSEISQVYLASVRGLTHRIRKRVTGGEVRYYETKKIRLDKCSSREIEGEITESDFNKLLEKRAQDTKPIIKVRHSFSYKNQLFEVDIYPEWEHTCILETELSSRDKKVEFPQFLRILREVTGVREYSNASMSRAFPPEERP